MSESPIDGHLDHRVKAKGAIEAPDLEKLKKVYRFFHQLKKTAYQLELCPELVKKLEVKNIAYKKLLAHHCETKDSPINHYLDEIWKKRFKD